MTERPIALPPVSLRDAPCSNHKFPTHQTRQLPGDRAQCAGCQCFCRASSHPMTSMTSEFSSAPNAPIPKSRDVCFMSALPRIATAKADSRKRSCLLYPRKRTCAVQRGMSALGQKRAHAVQQNDTRWCLLDHLVRGAVGSSSAARCTIPRSFGSAKGAPHCQFRHSIFGSKNHQNRLETASEMDN